jgi:8-oxo-dGTP pyrophosphatase MutT (NUDIX family)
LEILLVTTRGTRRWIVPKGWPIKGLRPAKSAAREAFEEAGVTGRIGPKPIGVFAYDKLRDEAGGATMCEVKIYPLRRPCLRRVPGTGRVALRASAQ